MGNGAKEPALQYNYISPEEYLAAEMAVIEKHEYYHGEVFVMGRASFNHNGICINTTAELSIPLSGSGCKPYRSTLRIPIPSHYIPK